MAGTWVPLFPMPRYLQDCPPTTPHPSRVNGAGAEYSVSTSIHPRRLSFNKYLLSTNCMPGFVLDRGHTAENKAVHGAPVLEKGVTINKGTNTQIVLVLYCLVTTTPKLCVLKDNSHFIISHRFYRPGIQAGLGWAILLPVASTVVTQ